MAMTRVLLVATALAASVAAVVHGEKPTMAYKYADAAAEAERPSWRTQSEEQHKSERGPVWIQEDGVEDAAIGTAPHVLGVPFAEIGNANAPTINDHNDQQARLTAYPPLIQDGEDLVVSWDGVQQPHEKDFLGLSCGPTVHSMDMMIKIGVDHEDAMPHSVRFPQLFMMRCNYTVVYYNFQLKRSDFVAIGSLEVGLKESFNAPKHGHIALTSKLDEMAVMFNSASQKTPQVKYGLRASELSQSASGNSSTYTASDMCHAPANITGQTWFRDPGFMHKVILTGLESGETYFYRFGNDDDGWSAVYSFKARPSAQVKTANFIAYADMGVEGAPSATSTAVRSFQEVLSGGYDSFLLHFGDISYARGQAFMWDQFFHIVEPYATRVPYMVSIGNHEYDYVAGGERDPSGAAGADGRMGFHPSWANYGEDSSGECSVPMYHRWHAPENGRGIYWYSFDYGGVHVVQMSSEHDWTRGSEQYKWLESDLKAVDRSQTPWVVLTSHRMMYTTQLGEVADLEVSLHFREEVEELLWKYKVNLMLVGHQHSYERSCAVKRGKCTKDGVGPVHIVVGSAGAGLEQKDFSADIGEWSVSHINDWGYLRVASTEEQMTVQFVLNRNGAVYDEVALKPWA